MLDKTGFKKFVLLLLRIYGILFLFMLPFLIFVTIFVGVSNGQFSIGLLFTNILSTAIAILILFAFIFFIGFLVYLYNALTIKRNTVNTKDFYRELPNTYSPAIASAVLDLNTEITTDYPATISYLCTKKYIEMHEENDNIYFSIINDNTYGLNEHEQYVFDCLFKGKTFTNDVFKSKVKKDAIKLGLIEEGRRKVHFFRNFFISIFVCFLLSAISGTVPENTFIYNLLNFIFLLSGLSIFAVIFGSIFLSAKYQNENYHRTSKGNKDAKKWSAFKHFLHEYTLISEKELNYTEILEEYIPYAICLGEGKAIEKFVANNKIYRDLLYKYNL